MSTPATVAELFPAWQVKFTTVPVTAGVVTKVLGADPLRWIVSFQIDVAVIGGTVLRPWSASSPIAFTIPQFPVSPLFLSQKDFGPLPAGEWYIDAVGAPFDLFIVEILWKG